VESLRVQEFAISSFKARGEGESGAGEKEREERDRRI